MSARTQCAETGEEAQAASAGRLARVPAAELSALGGRVTEAGAGAHPSAELGPVQLLATWPLIQAEGEGLFRLGD